MKGMFLSSFYATRKQTYIYFIVAIIAADTLQYLIR